MIIAFVAFLDVQKTTRSARIEEAKNIIQTLSNVLNQDKNSNLLTLQRSILSFQTDNNDYKIYLIDKKGVILSANIKEDASEGQRLSSQRLQTIVTLKTLHSDYIETPTAEKKVWAAIPFKLEHFKNTSLSGFIYLELPLYHKERTLLDRIPLFIWASLLSLIIGIYFIFKLITKITKPLLLLQTKAARIIGGERNISFKEYSKSKKANEINEIGKAFHFMDQAETLQSQKLNNLIKSEKSLNLIKEKSNDERVKFFSIMTQKTRAPMNNIRSTLDLLCDSDLSSQQKKWTETIKTSGNLLISIIGEVIGFSKQDFEPTFLSEEDFDIRDFIKEITDHLSTRAQINNTHLESKVASDIPNIIHTKPDIIKQILNTLIKNAINFTHEGRIIVSIKWDPDALTMNRTLLFSVRDTGSGISSQSQAELFSDLAPSNYDIFNTKKIQHLGFLFARNQ